MRTHIKPRILAIPLGRDSRQAGGVATESDEPAAVVPGLQSLAAELHQAAIQGRFDYPQTWTLASRVAAAALFMISLVHMALVLVPAMQTSTLASWSVAGAVIGVVLAGVTGVLALNLLPSIQVTPQGLGVSGLLGWRRIPWKQVGTLRVMELPGKGRYVVMIPFSGATQPRTPAPFLRIMPRLLGASQKGEQGVIVTSHIKNFERLLQLIVAYMAQAAGQTVPAIEAFVDEAAVMPIAQLALAPSAALVRMARHDADRVDTYGVRIEDDGPPVSWPKVLSRQLLIAAAPALVLFMDWLNRGSAPQLSAPYFLWLGLVVAVGVLELPFIAKLTQAVGDLMVGSGEFKTSVWAYLELQVPRTVLVFLGAALLGSGLPALLAQVCWLVGIALTTVLATRFVKKIYYLPLSHTLLAALGVLIYQAVMFALYFGVR
ncbi:MAG TPA: hypothetical protein VEW94_00355 [Chloroflexia bacterium]|nr:hypothetical protein [Chloroflexia bacterium]